MTKAGINMRLCLLVRKLHEMHQTLFHEVTLQRCHRECNFLEFQSRCDFFRVPLALSRFVLFGCIGREKKNPQHDRKSRSAAVVALCSLFHMTARLKRNMRSEVLRNSFARWRRASWFETPVAPVSTDRCRFPRLKLGSSSAKTSLLKRAGFFLRLVSKTFSLGRVLWKLPWLSGTPQWWFPVKPDGPCGI